MIKEYLGCEKVCRSRTVGSPEPVLTEERNKVQGLAVVFAFKLYLLLPNR